jgi:PIN domain nuclease of toxin-antitoxin system
VTAVLDASAFLAFAFGESGADRVAEHLADCAISAVNAAEIVAKLQERGTPPGEADSVWSHVEALTRPFTSSQARACGLLRGQTRSSGLSLGDRACIALAQQIGDRVLTADRAWATLDLGIEIEVIR